MKFTIYKASDRGHANHGWLDTYHSFSFADYYDPRHINFGMLRVLNDDTMEGGTGFGTHPHDNMEIVSFPIEGDLEHRDSMGNVSVISKGEIQVMSAGTGITHSEYNKNDDRLAAFLQIWIFPDAKGHKPRYDTVKIDYAGARDNFLPIVVPRGQTGGAWINQDAWMHIARIGEGRSVQYTLKDRSHGIYVFVIGGRVRIEGDTLEARDAAGIVETDRVAIYAEVASEVLIIEVPMHGYPISKR